jgi:glycine cleavage system H protein
MPDFLEKHVDKFTFRVATDRLYSPEGVWVLAMQSPVGTQVQLGITDYVQQHSGDAAFVSVKPRGTRLAAGEDVAEFETVKTAFSLLCPVAGTVVAVNPALDATPEIVNDDPYGKGWLAVIETADWGSDRARLLDPQAYFSLMEAQVQQELQEP